MDDRELGRRIGYWRRRRKLTQAVFADRIGRSKSWVEKVERGERSAGRLSVLDGICEVLQVEQIAAPEVRCRPITQAAIADLLHRCRGTPSLALAGLAERAGVRP